MQSGYKNMQRKNRQQKEQVNSCVSARYDVLNFLIRAWLLLAIYQMKLITKKYQNYISG